jgi:hypothetical protein
VKRAEPNAALAELWARHQELGLDPFRIDNPPAPPVVMPEPLRLERPDWEQEARERAARERDARIAEATALLEQTNPPPRPTPPAAPTKSRWRRSPA